jgi:hypothetical protein
VAHQDEDHEAYWDSFWDAKQVFYGHVLGFKGLERRAVVLVVDEFVAFEHSRERLYVGLSRALDELTVCGGPEFLAEVVGPGWCGGWGCRRLRLTGLSVSVPMLSTMSTKLAAAHARLQAVDRAVSAGEAGADRRLWGGAGLVVVAAMPEPGCDESARYVVTPHAARLSWLVRAAWAVCGPLFDSATKSEFFGRLGNAARRYQQRAGDRENARDLLGAVVHEAYETVSDIECGRFQTLPVAPAGFAHDDLLPDSERDDALSDTEFAQWFKDHDVQ